MKLSAWRDDVSLSPGYSLGGLIVAAGLGGNGAAVNRVGVSGGDESRLPENAGSKSSGGMLGGAAPVERCVRNVAWLN